MTKKKKLPDRGKNVFKQTFKLRGSTATLQKEQGRKTERERGKETKRENVCVCLCKRR